jgi:hypothetical protein
MQSWTQQISPDNANDYLANLRDLAGELEKAMDAIAQQELPELRRSIDVQQTVCSRLAHMQRKRSLTLAGDPRSQAQRIEPDLDFQIGEAIAAVLVLNRRYAALLKHSGETLRLFAGLFRSYQGSTQPPSGMQGNLQTWSCEV